MCTRRFAMILVSFCLLAVFTTAAGCAALDVIARDVNDVGAAARQSARDPASPLPGEARTTLELFGLATAAGYGLYQKFRYGELKKTAKIIVDGVERTDPQFADKVLEKVKEQMIKAGSYERRNRLVDELKRS